MPTEKDKSAETTSVEPPAPHIPGEINNPPYVPPPTPSPGTAGVDPEQAPAEAPKPEVETPEPEEAPKPEVEKPEPEEAKKPEHRPASSSHRGR